MPSNLYKNTGVASVYRTIRYLANEIWIPPESVAGVCASQVLSTGSLAFVTVPTRLGVPYQGGFSFHYPMPLTLTSTADADTYTALIVGRDQYGAPITETFYKTSTGVNSKSSHTFRCWSFVSSITIVGPNTPTNSVSVGSIHTTALTQRRVPLPVKLSTSAQILGAVYQTNASVALPSAVGGTPNAAAEAGDMQQFLGDVNTATQDTVLTQNGAAVGWTPNMLARNGIGTYVATLGTVEPAGWGRMIVQIAPSAVETNVS